MGGIIKIERLYFRVKNMSEEEKKVPLEDGNMKEVKEGEEEQQKENSKEIPPVPKEDVENTNVETEKQKYIKNKVIDFIKGHKKMVAIIVALIIVFILMTPSSKIVGKDLTYDIGDTVTLDVDHLVDKDATDVDLTDIEIESELISDTSSYTYNSYKNTVITKGLNCLDAGTYEVTLKDKSNESVKDTIEITVVDKKAPKFVDFKDVVEVDEGDTDFSLKDAFEAKDDSKVSISVDKGNFNVNKKGEYKIKVTAKDTSGNKITKKATVKVVQKVLSGIEATYNGKTGEGATIDKSSDITVIAKYEDGSSKEVYDWTIDNPATLKADETSTVTVKYRDKTYDLSVQCSTVGEQGFKNQCQNIAYEELARNGNSHIGEKVKFYGQVLQVMNGSGNSVTLRVSTKSSAYGNWYDDVVLVEYEYKSGQPKFLEDDMITFYGYVYGDYSYEAVSGATITIPAVLASYIDM